MCVADVLYNCSLLLLLSSYFCILILIYSSVDVMTNLFSLLYVHDIKHLITVILYTGNPFTKRTAVVISTLMLIIYFN